jgi:hypothetical protein
MARLYNLEWVFEKSRNAGWVKAVRSLAMAVERLPRDWPLDDSQAVRAQADDLLGLNTDSSWYERAWETVQRCHPPLAELSSWSHGLAFVRWVAHRILPYPTFVFDDLHFAARLRMTVDSLRSALGSSQGEALFDDVRYRGICEGLVDRRWWRAGLETLLWNITDGAPFDAPTLHNALLERGFPVDRLEIQDPVVCLGRDLLPMAELGSSQDSVRLFPDDWPPFADLPWAEIDLVLEHESLRTIVLAPDQDRLKSDLDEDEDE